MYSEKRNTKKIAIVSAVFMALLFMAVGFLKLCKSKKGRQERANENTTDIELTEDSVISRGDPMENSIEKSSDDKDEPEHEVI